MLSTKTARIAAALLVLLMTSACDTDLYSNTAACRDDDANTVCPIDGSTDSLENSVGNALSDAHQAPSDNQGR
jgi:hypothetical protein